MADEEHIVVKPEPEEIATIPCIKYEYLDHPADVQIHAWGDDLREAYEQAAMGMYGYMTEIDTVEMVEVREVEAEAEDLQGLLFHFLDECLFVFSCEPYFIPRKVVITDWKIGGGEGKEEGEGGGDKEGKEGGGDKEGEGGEDKEGKEGGDKEGKEVGGDKEEGGGGGEEEGGMRISAKLYGEEFQLGKHPQGTEVKAVTYASMKVYDKPGQHELFVIVDI